ncbi:dihydrodipicolinate reductase [Fluviibacterium sp. S390]|uniref:dihydrodipicolinate reductase n=1 Tax=Fluviibacterium sp. S390 TaxID=3415139 RepID=UPI003C7BC1B4
MPYRVFAWIAGVSVSLVATAAVADYSRITDKRTFAEMVAGRQLTRLGIELTVTPGGDIRGSAFGKQVSGAWEWQNGYFCRDLVWGERDLGFNCQEVALKGRALKFTSDRGAGPSASLTLR